MACEVTETVHYYTGERPKCAAGGCDYPAEWWDTHLELPFCDYAYDDPANYPGRMIPLRPESERPREVEDSKT